ncbi:hypothetical protein LTR50_006431 [Elasticomyces elasticus]|nr:hypothetical protein LTR50_006431 [Elasticomyces elasticus]
MTRQKTIARSIVYAVLYSNNNERIAKYSRLIAYILSFFALFRLNLVRYAEELFCQLRKDWSIDEDDYRMSFGKSSSEVALQAKGHMGYSGSSFFTTANAKYIIKSVPRAFEYQFFRDNLLEPYAEHMRTHPASLLVRITDFLCTRHATLGGLLGTAPTHHIVMENVLYEQAGTDDDNQAWQTFDLKPTSYFFPERDIAGGYLASEATKSRLADKFEDKLMLSAEQADDFKRLLESDTKMLENANAVDYSLYLVRIPIPPPEPSSTSNDDPFADPVSSGGRDTIGTVPPKTSPWTAPSPTSWRTGIKSADGRFLYRAVLLDFFWAKHKLQAQVMTVLIKSWNLVARQGPMSITTTADEYRERFLKMCADIVEVRPV